MRPRAKAREDGTRLDMTPMIDVTFLLLIFFLCLEFKTLEGKLLMHLPKDAGPSSRATDPIDRLDVQILTVDTGTRRDDASGGRYVLEGHRVEYRVGASHVRDIGALQRMLEREASVLVPDPSGRRRVRPVRVASGPGVVYRDVTEVIDLARVAGFHEVAFAPPR